MRTRWQTMTSGLIAAVALASWAPAAQAEDKPQVRVAVRSFSAKGLEQSTASTLETVFCDALAKESYDVLCSEDLNAILTQRQQELGLGQCESDDDCLKSVGEIAHAAKMVTGEVSKVGDTYLISVTMIDVASGRVSSRATEKTTKLEQLLDKVPSVAHKLATGK